MANLITTNPKTFYDIDLDFDVHPNTKKLNIVSGETAIIRSLKNLIMTNFYERLFHPEIGCNVRGMLFEPIMPSTADRIQNAILETIGNYEPRVEIREVVVKTKPDENGYEVGLRFFIINETTERTIGFFLERIR